MHTAEVQPFWGMSCHCALPKEDQKSECSESPKKIEAYLLGTAGSGALGWNVLALSTAVVVMLAWLAAPAGDVTGAWPAPGRVAHVC